MARPKTDTIVYFQHDANASGGDTLTVLEERFGNDGYAFWFKLLEKLAATDGHYLDCSNPMKWQALCAKAHVKPERGEAILVLLLEMEAVDPELWRSRVIWCQKLVNRMEDVYKNRKRPLPKKPVSTSKTLVSTIETTLNKGIQGISAVEMPQSKVKEIIVKDSKVTTTPIPPPSLLLSSSSEVVLEKTVFQLWDEEILPSKKWTPLISNEITDLVDHFSEEWVRLAVKEAALHNIRNFKYIQGILENWASEGGPVSPEDLKTASPALQKFGDIVKKTDADVEDLLKVRGIIRGPKRTIEEIQQQELGKR